VEIFKIQVQKDSWNTFGRLAGFAVTSSISAGFTSSNSQSFIDDNLLNLGKGSLAGDADYVAFNGITKGLYSNIIGGVLAQPGNDAIAAGSIHGINLTNEVRSLGSAISSTILHNWVETDAIINPLKNNISSYGAHFLTNYVSGVVSNFVGNIDNLKNTHGMSILGWNSLLSAAGGWPSDFFGGDTQETIDSQFQNIWQGVHSQ
jgi:hypothetical protein